MTLRPLYILLLISLLGCKSAYQNQSDTPEKIPQAPDYNLKSSWAVIPSKYTEEFKMFASNELDSLQVDVFYVYPTFLVDKKDTSWNADITNASHRNTVITNNTTIRNTPWKKSATITAI